MGRRADQWSSMKTCKTAVVLQKGHFHKSEQRSEPKALSFTVGEQWWHKEAHSVCLFFPDKSMVTLTWIQVNDRNEWRAWPSMAKPCSILLEAFGLWSLVFCEPFSANQWEKLVRWTQKYPQSASNGTFVQCGIRTICIVCKASVYWLNAFCFYSLIQSFHVV